MTETQVQPRGGGQQPQTGKRWFFKNFPNTQEALNFVNGSPAQVAGEISATARNDGTVGLFYFSTQQ